MKRQIIQIDEDKCTGCGQCIPGCPEGALQIIDGKARLINDLFCDGLGACIGTCPEGAIEIEEREAEPYNERKVMENIITQGPNVIKAHLRHLKEHNEMELYNIAINVLKEKGIEVPKLEPNAHTSGGQPAHNSNSAQGTHGGFSHEHHGHGGCPGAAMMDFRKRQAGTVPQAAQGNVAVGSQLRQWPVQLQLLNPHAPYFQNAELLVAADCVPFAYANFHQRFLKGKIMITFCPKLDKTIDQYIDKLSVIFRDNHIKSVSVVHMEVPCCSGTLVIIQRAMERAKKIIPIKDYTISISGEII